MLQSEVLSPTETQKAAALFHRDGFVVIKDTLTPKQLKFAQDGANRIIQKQTEETELEKANRGFARYSFGDQMHHPEWAQLIDLETTAFILEAIWNSTEYTCGGAGGDYSVPGAKMQPLHSDIGEFLHDPLGQVSFHDLPATLIVINFLMVDFTRENGAIRFVPSTQRSRAEKPNLDDEPQWMRDSILCAPAGTAVIRDVRCWHGGTANTSNMNRPMTSVGYYAPWFKPRYDAVMPRARYNELSPREQQLCKTLISDE